MGSRETVTPVTLGAEGSSSTPVPGQVQFADILLPFIMALLLVTVLEPVKQARVRLVALHLCKI